MTLPIVHLTGTPYEQGTAHGRELRGRIAYNLDVYFTRFEREAGLSRPVVRRAAARYADAIAAQNPDYHAGMRGVAEGSGFDLLDIAALNVRYELLYYQFGKLAIALEEARQRGLIVEPEVDGCT